jgi:hypothetical protein
MFVVRKWLLLTQSGSLRLIQIATYFLINRQRVSVFHSIMFYSVIFDFSIGSAGINTDDPDFYRFVVPSVFIDQSYMFDANFRTVRGKELSSLARLTLSWISRDWE